jgi:hypothetical protein
VPIYQIGDIFNTEKINHSALNLKRFFFGEAMTKNIESNHLAQNGVENIYPETIFKGFIKTETDSQGIETKKFDPKRKRDFTGQIQASQNISDFQNYESLILKIESLLT